MIECIFQGSRALVLIAVFVTAVSSLLLYASRLNVLANVVLDFARQVPAMVAEGKVLAVQFLKLLNLDHAAPYRGEPLLAVRDAAARARQCIAIYALQITTFHDLEITLAPVAVVIMVILFLEQIVANGASVVMLGADAYQTKAESAADRSRGVPPIGVGYSCSIRR